MQTNEEFKKHLEEHPEQDPIGMEGFLITESFESLFSNLIGVYSRLSTKESFKNAAISDPSKIKAWRKRKLEISMIKNTVAHMQLADMSKHTAEYRRELIIMEKLEADEYYKTTQH